MKNQQPLAVFIQTTSGCNSDCVICPQKKSFARFGKHTMSLELFNKILNDLGSDYTGQIGLYLHYEPLLDERLFGLLDLAKEKCPKASIEISSNGQLLDKEKAQKLAASKIDIVYFNVNGATKQTYEQQMRGLNFERTVENIRYFRSIFPRTIRINFVLTNDNVNEKDLVAKLFPGCEIINQYWAVNRAGNVEINKPQEVKTRFNEQGGCQQLDMNLPILANGDVILCCNDWMHEVVIGNAAKDNILDLWRSPAKKYGYDICKRCI